MKVEDPLIGMVIRTCVFYLLPIKTLCSVGYPVILALGVMKRQTLLPSLDLPRVKVGVLYTDFKLHISHYILSTWQDDWNGAVASFCQADPGDLAVLFQAVQEGWNCLVLCPHRSYTLDPFAYVEEASSTSSLALSVHCDFSQHFAGMQ